MKHLKTFENFKMKAFFHGSSEFIKNNTILKPHADSYVKQVDNDFLEKLMEKYRPESKISRYDAVFMVDNMDLIDDAGGSTDFIYEVSPIGEIERSDLAWYSEVQAVDEEENENLIKEYALNYWNGVKFHDEESSLWEYRAKSAIVIDLIEEN
jgi:tRNA uridine 5-carbamoylmethylation protein Kti12